MKQDILSTVDDLSTFIRTVPNDTFLCYRGQSDTNWDLIPSFYRGLDEFQPPPNDVDDGEWIGCLERDIYRTFDLKGRRFAPRGWAFGDPWHRMILAQHYGAPTRLLDWSKNPFVGAYFAVTANADRDGALWCLDVTAMPAPEPLGRRMEKSGFRIEQIENCLELDQVSFIWPVSKGGVFLTSSARARAKRQAIPSGQSGNPERDGFLVVVEPPILEGRLHSQKSLFTVYISYDEAEVVWDHKIYIEEVEQHCSKILLTKLIIPRNIKGEMKRDLERSYIHVDDIFPDLPGLVERLKRQRSDKFAFWKDDRKNWEIA